jgi:hypothetical protein
VGAFRGWTRKVRLRVISAVVAAVVVGGVLLGINLTSGDNPVTHPATAATGSTASSTKGTDAASGGADSDAEGSGATGAGTGSTGGASQSGSTSSDAPGTTAPGPQKVDVICTIVSGNLSAVVTLSSCSQLSTTGGSGTFAGSLLSKSGSGTIAWEGTGTTTFVYVSAHPASQKRKCPEGDTETTLRGSIIGNTPIGPRNVGVKGALHAKLCIDPQLDVSLLAGRTIQL